MPKKSVAIGELLFNAKGEAKSYFTEILNKYPLDIELHGKEFDDVMALLLCHPTAIEKIGSGVKSIKVDQGFYSSNRCFHIVRVDDTVEDFSIGKITFEEAHIDHREPLTFSAIVHFFIQANTIDINTVDYVTEGKYGNEFKNNELAENFRDWHRQNAKIRIVKGKANLAKSYLGRISNTKADQTLN